MSVVYQLKDKVCKIKGCENTFDPTNNKFKFCAQHRCTVVSIGSGHNPKNLNSLVMTYCDYPCLNHCVSQDNNKCASHSINNSNHNENYI